MNIDIRERNSDEILEVKTFIMVARKGYGNDWAVYYGELTGVLDLDPQVVNMISAEGDKVPEDAAKFNFFPNISGGPYRA